MLKSYHYVSHCLAHVSLTDLLSTEPHSAPTTKAPFMYSSCAGHADCGTDEFCGVKCWTGGCDEGRDDPKGKKRKKHDKFCQPCAKCKKGPDSVTRSCDICKVSYDVTLYRSCTRHSDCGTDQFCGVECWTGGCDEGRDDPKGKKRKKNGKFCQPCTKCKRPTDSVTHSCGICTLSGRSK